MFAVIKTGGKQYRVAANDVITVATLAGELETIFERQIRGARAWRVSLDDGDLRWSDGKASFDKDPEATAWQRFLAWTTRVLHLDAQL